jgi:hypothetical protein
MAVSQINDASYTSERLKSSFFRKGNRSNSDFKSPLGDLGVKRVAISNRLLSGGKSPLGDLGVNTNNGLMV